MQQLLLNVPCKFHEEDFRVKEYNKEVLKDLFAEFEFKTLGKRILGDEYNVFVVRKTGNTNRSVWKCNGTADAKA